jgi:hypothetical protein
MPWDDEEIERIAKHVEQFTGVEAGVFHELIPTSMHVHVDIHVAEPTPERAYYTAFTTGMSDEPMKVPEGSQGHPYAELMLCLPGSWPESELTPDDTKYGWPLMWLKMLAQAPTENEICIARGDTIPNGDPPGPLASKKWYNPFAAPTKFCCWFIMRSSLYPEEFQTFQFSDEKTIHWYAAVPIYKEEMDFKLKEGAEALHKRLTDAGVTELIDSKRKNVCA